MAYVVVCIATRWGSALGGINVFNTGLAQGFASVLPKPGQCFCVVQEFPAAEPEAKVKLLKPEKWELAPITDVVFQQVETLPLRDIEEVLIIGHDIHTGTLAIDCAKQLKARWPRGTKVRSAVISHMSYLEYARRKGQALTEVLNKSRSQHEIVASADHAFAVGPLLANSFQSSRIEHNDRVIALTPGAADIQAEPEKADSLTFYIGGRLGLEDDTIKNGVLSVRAVIAAYETERKTGQVGRWTTRGHFYACGVDPAKDADLLSLLKKDAQKNAMFVIEATPFSDKQDEVHEHLARSDVAIMPSWHEGFGLTGWEAICAGVPLVCSSQSGLALLIDQLRRTLADADFRSIEVVQLTGGAPAGMPSASDVETLSIALRAVVADYPARKKAALALALRIKRHFTWERCAEELIAPFKWPWANSADWHQRQQAAELAVELSDSVASAGVVLEALAACRAGKAEQKWALVCSALNYFSDVGAKATIRERRTLRDDLLTVAQAVSASLKARATAGRLLIADTVFLDLCWRYMAAASRVATTFSEFVAMLPAPMRDAIFGDGFLRRELLFYVCRFSSDFEDNADELALSFLSPLRQYLGTDAGLVIRVARLTAVYASLRRLIPVAGSVAFEAEIDRCQRALARPFDSRLVLEESPDLAPTMLALSSLKPDLSRQPIDQPIGFFKRLSPKNVTGTWRGDKRLTAGMATVVLSCRKVEAVLEAMANDEEEAIRWAALDLAFSPVLRARLHALETDSDGARTLCAMLGRIVDMAVSKDEGHPWLAREFLNHYCDELAAPRDHHPQLARFTLTDFPVSRELFGPAVNAEVSRFSRAMHPEVEDARARGAQSVQRVLLVLPPISIDPAAGRAASKTSTPPLGLGVLATHLSKLGHDVHLVDCHRFPELAEEIFCRAKTFDLIGFNTVFSTIKSTRQMLTRIRSATQRPVLVVGGPAANLDAWRFSALDENDLANWDFAISNDAVGNLQLLVEALKSPTPWPVSDGVVANPRSTVVALRDVATAKASVVGETGSPPSDEGWMKIHVDRRLYAGPAGQYEPTRTRDLKGRVHEAHIVMSKGCDWNCSFCTERRILSHGERRRDVESVLDEVRQLAKRYPDLRIQFIDDNLLPQIASPHNSSGVRREEGKAWAVRFLAGMKEIRDEFGGKLSWRGIFRLEDFAAYEALGEAGGFVRALAEAGCNMLAFGVESGDAASRHSLKAGGREFTNDAIQQLFRRLRQAKIFTKAYFIIGGHKESAQSTERTISFAVECGATLAYFALYKDFVDAQKELRKDRGTGHPETASLLDYEQLLFGWDEAFSGDRRAGDLGTARRLIEPSDVVERRTYRLLAKMGFRFDDLVKYNDYHAQAGHAKARLHSVTWQRPNEFFGLVEKAYRKFYLRPEFVADFKELVAAGY
ncbi:radical SAM protein [Ideonella sp.]|uniref:radical SAM protein n=1 Tax=Ideonella sp. TaxID=1929293 RepID=UPI0035B4696B